MSGKSPAHSPWLSTGGRDRDWRLGVAARAWASDSDIRRVHPAVQQDNGRVIHQHCCEMKRDRWFDELERRGIDPWTDDVPDAFDDDRWLGSAKLAADPTGEITQVRHRSRRCPVGSMSARPRGDVSCNCARRPRGDALRNCGERLRGNHRPDKPGFCGYCSAGTDCRAPTRLPSRGWDETACDAPHPYPRRQPVRVLPPW
jgi:hypothetical protein